MNTSSLRDLRHRYGEALDEEVETVLSTHGGPDALREMMGMLRYQLGYTDESLTQITAAGGKRFRPILCLLCCEGTGGAWQEALPVAASIELLHNFSLIHDDIEDRDPVRHHRPTVWKIWGEPQAINAGDSMFALASQAVLDAEVSAEIALEVARSFQETALSLTEGQYLDMRFESRLDVTPDEYLEMIARKTGSLIAFSCWAGATIAGADCGTRRALHTFGSEFGRAFQIQDDIRGIWASPDTTGKEPAKDLRNRKKTLPVLLALALAEREGQDALHEFFDRRSDNLLPVLEVLTETNARQHAQDAVTFHLEAARTALQGARLDHRHALRLQAFAAELVGQ